MNGTEPGFGRMRVAPSPHLSSAGVTTQQMMRDVLIALAPALAVAVFEFRWYAVLQVGLCVLTSLAAEWLFSRMRGRPATLRDLSAAVTGLILGLSFPWSAPWYVAVIASLVAIGLGKAVFGGLGQNLFNPAMVGRAFVMISFPGALGAAAYEAAVASGAVDVVTRATPLTLAKQLGQSTGLWPLLAGTVNGSLGETSALACILGGLYLCWRRVAPWQIPAGMILSVGVLGALAGFGGAAGLDGALHHVLAGAVLFGAFFIATDPVSSPLTPRGQLLFGIGAGVLVMLIRALSGYPEGVMFAVLLMNAVTPLINRWTVPTPVGGPVPVAAGRAS